MPKPTKTNRSISVASRTLGMLRFVLFLVALTGVFLYTRVSAPTHVSAATSSYLNFQARLLSSTGSLVPDGTYNVEFKLYDSLAAGASAQGVCVGGGTDDCLWVETRTAGNKVTVKNGYLSVYLGQVTALPNINWDQDIWLTMNIGGSGAPTWDGEMTPRLKLTAVPYAMSAGQLAKFNGTQTGTLSFNTVANSPDIKLPDVTGTNNVLLQSGTTLFTQGSIPFTDSTGRLTENNSKFFWDNSTNRLGIGTNSPGTALEISVVNTSNQLRIRRTGASAGFGDIYADTNGLYVQADGATQDYLVLNPSGGNVGIGTTSPQEKLHVDGVGAGLRASRSDGSGFIQLERTDALAANTILGVVDFIGVDSASTRTSFGQINGFAVDATDTTEKGALTFYTRNAGSLTERMRIDNVGNVGIGDTDPAYQLTVGNGDLFGVDSSGNINFEGSSADAFETVLGLVNPTADQTYRLPNSAAGTYDICTSANNCASLGAYIQNGTSLQSSANFAIQSAGDSSITGVIRTRASQTADLLQFQNSAGTNPLSGINSAGNLYYRDGTSGFVATLGLAGLSADRSILLPNAGGTICTTSGNCIGNGGAGDIFNGGQAGPITIGTNDNTTFTLETNNTPVITMLGSGNVGIGTITPTGLLQVSQPSAGTGTVATNGTTTLTGTNTQFLNTFKVGDTITVSGETVRTITAIASNTSLTVSVAFSTTASGLSYTLAGGDRLTVLGNGNVGIGTTNLGNAELTVEANNQNVDFILRAIGTGQYSVLNFSDEDNNSAGQVRYDHNTDRLEFTTSGVVQRAVIDSVGNLGIGTANPQAQLQVQGASTSSGSTTMTASNGATTFTTSASITLNVGDYIVPSTTNVPRAISIGGTGTSFTVSSAFTSAVTGETFTIHRPITNLTNSSGTSALFVQGSTGNVGIGTSNIFSSVPSSAYKLQVHNSIGSTSTFVSTDDTANAILVLGTDVDAGAAARYGQLGYDYANNVLKLVNGSSFSASTNGIAINTSGNVGIGTTAPTGLLQVTQATAGTGTVATSGTTTLTGTNTQFLNTFKVGDTITVSGETVRTITAIASNTSLTVSVAFSTTASGLSYTLAGGDRLTVLGNGNVGIGTTTPTAKLSIDGGSDNRIFITGSTRSALALGQNGTDYGGLSLAGGANEFATGAANQDIVLRSLGATNKLHLATGSTPNVRLTIDTTGNVGIGTTGPVSRLHVDDAGGTVLTLSRTAGLTSGTLGQLNFGNIDIDNQLALIRSVNDGATDAGNLEFHTEATGGSLTQRMTITSGGNVGIGITGPTSVLHTVATGAKTANYTGNLLTNTATSSTASINKYGLEIQSTGTWNGTSANNVGLYVSSVTGGTNNYDAIFNGGGNVGIGTTAPEDALHVVNGLTLGDTINTAGFINTARSLVISIDSDGNQTDRIFSVTNNAVDGAGSELFRVQENGNIGFNTTSFGTSAVGVFALGQATAPSTSPTDNVQLYVTDAGAGDARLRVRMEGGGIVTFPNETGTICTTGSVCSGYAAAAANGYVQFAPATVQADSTTNSSIFINKTGASGNILQLQRSGVDALVVDNAGNVGIGTASLPASTKLEVSGSVNGQVISLVTNAHTGTSAISEFVVRNATSDPTADGLRLLAMGTNFTSSGGFIQDSGVLSADLNLSGGLSVMTRANAPIRFYTNGSTNERVRFDENGNVGIGITNPGSILHTVATGAKTANYTGNRLTNTATSSTASINKYGLEIQSTGTWNGTSANNVGLYVSSVTGGTNNYDAIFNGGGNVGIGTIAPSAKLHVTGTTDIVQTLIKGNATQTSNIVEVHPGSSTNIVFGINNTGQASINAPVSSTTLLTVGTTGYGGFSTASSTNGIFVMPTNSGLGNITGIGAQPVSTAVGTVAGLTGIQAGLRTANAGLTVTSGKSFEASSPTVSSGAITTQYGLYINQQDVAGVGTGYGIYQASATDLNYFAGNVGIATTTFGTSAAGVFALGQATAPSTSPADNVQLYVTDAGAGDARLRVRMEGGGIVTFPNETGTICTTGSVCSGYQAAPTSGNYLFQVPTSTAANTVTPTNNSVVGLTVNGTSGTAATAVNIVQAGNATALNISGLGTGNLAVMDTTNASANGVSIDVQSNSSSQYALNVTTNNGATNVLYARADGNVGIGTASPASKLQVSTNGGFIDLTDSTDSDNVRTRLGSSVSNGGFLQMFDSSEASTALIRSYAASGVQAYFTAGNIGIGTSAPDDLLHLSKSAVSGVSTLQFSAGNTTTVGHFSSGRIVSGHTTTNYLGAYLDLQYPTAEDTFTTGLRLMNGNVGIGQPTPTSILHTVATGAKTANYTGNLLTNTATSSTASINKYGLEIQSTGTWNGTSANNVGLYVSSVTGGTNNYDAIFNGGGNVGVGLTAPNAKLHVQADAGISSGATTMTATSGATTFTTSASITLNQGDVIVPTTSSTRYVSIATTATGTSFTVSQPFGANITTETFTIYRSALRVNSSLGGLHVQGYLGRVGVGAAALNPVSEFSNSETNYTDTAGTGVGQFGFLWDSRSSTLSGYTAVLRNTSNSNIQSGLLISTRQSATNNFPLRIETGIAGSTTARFVVRGDGNVGIGTSAPTSDLAFGGDVARAIKMEVNTGNVAGNNLTIAAGGGGAGASAVAGGQLILQGGAAGGSGAAANGGAVTISGGAGVGTGTQGLVNLSTTAFSSASVQTFAASGSITAGNIDLYSTLPVTASAASVVVTVPDPAQSVMGRIVYISARSGSNDFTLRFNSARTPIDIAMKANSTATLIWNGTDWTAAGASSSTDLQSAYNNTLTSAGGAELVLNASGGAADGLTIRNNATTPISGGILEVQSSIGTNLFSVNNFGTELASNGGAETSSSFNTDWTVAGAASRTRTTTAGQFVTGLAGVSVTTTAAANDGVRNNLSANPVISTTYQVSFAAKLASGTFSTLDVRYSRDGGTDLEPCTSYSTQTLSTSVWTKITCTITTDSTTATDPDLIIRQTDATARTFYIDNLSFMRNDTTTQPSNVQIGGGINGGPVTLFTLDRSTAPPVANGNTTYYGSMYYDTTTGSIQCYEADGWGACGSPPDNIITLTPEYTGAVLNGSGIGTLTADFCANSAALTVGTLCGSNNSRQFYRWTSPQATEQIYALYVSYKLPSTFKAFNNDNTITLTALSDNVTNGFVTYEVFRSTGGAITRCYDGVTNETAVTSTVNTWQTIPINGAETGCGFAGGDNIIFKINVKSKNSANVYVENLNFTYTNR